MLNVIYIDEAKSDRHKFQRNFKNVFNVTALHPKSDIKAFVEELLSFKPDLIVTDYCLSDNAEAEAELVNYSGAELIKCINDYRLNFPCYVATAHEEEAVGSANPDSVYVKEDINNNENSKNKMIIRMESKVKQYKAWIEQIKSEHNALFIKQNSNGLTLDEEERFLELDNTIERVISGVSITPLSQKATQNTAMLKELIDKTNQILGKI